MNDDYSNRPIRPELIAAKLQRVRNFEQPAVQEEITVQPRFVEVLWFLQWVSQPKNYAGGLRRFSRDLIEQSRDLIGTSAMQKFGPMEYDMQQIRAAVKGFPWKAKRAMGVAEDPSSHLLCLSDDWDDRLQGQEIAEEMKDVLSNLSRHNLEEHCIHEAEENLPQYLRELCEQPHIRFTRNVLKDSGGSSEPGSGAPWYFVRVADAILRFMDRRKKEIAQTIAETEVTRLVFRWLGKAQAMCEAVRIEGNSRFGKTEAVSAWCEMNPGRARLVNTPSSSSESDLLREVARALGIEIGPLQKGHQLREQIGEVLGESGLMLVFDEAQFLFPSTFSRNTAPARLNWVRRTVLDRDLPSAFICTPQSYHSAKKRYVKTTGYAIEQFEERVLKTVQIPPEISSDDLLAIARIHFPGLADVYLQFVVNQAASLERNYVSDVAKIAKLARDNAREAGRHQPNFEDIKSAIADVLPTQPKAAAPTKQTARIAPAEPVQHRCTSPATPLSSSDEEPETVSNNRLTGARETRICESAFKLSV